MMDRRAFLIGAVALLATPLATEAQQPGKMWRVGYLAPPPVSVIVTQPIVREFQEGLRELGYIERRDYVMEWRGAGWDACPISRPISPNARSM